VRLFIIHITFFFFHLIREINPEHCRFLKSNPSSWHGLSVCVSPGRIVSSGLQEFLELSHSILVNIPTYPHFCRYFDGILWLKPSNFCNRSDLLPSWESMSYFISMHAVYLCTYTSDILSLLQSVYVIIIVDLHTWV
jgi:hypothetical protein